MEFPDDLRGSLGLGCRVGFLLGHLLEEDQVARPLFEKGEGAEFPLDEETRSMSFWAASRLSQKPGSVMRASMAASSEARDAESKKPPERAESVGKPGGIQGGKVKGWFGHDGERDKTMRLSGTNAC